MKLDKLIQINLGQYLSKRLYPLSLGIGLLISLCFPTTYYFLEYKGCKRTASFHAKKIADKFIDTIITSPNLWKYQIYIFTQIERETSQQSDVISIRLFDEKGVLIPNYNHQLQSGEAKAWWNRFAPRGNANIVFNNEKVGHVEIVLSQRTVLLKTALLFVISATVGMLLAFLSYHFPIRVVRRLETELQELFSNMQQAYTESDRLRHAAQESEYRFRCLVDGLDAIVWEADAETRQFTFISHQVENLFCISMGEWLRASDFFKDQIFSEDREKVLEAYQRSIEQRVDCQLEYRRVNKDDSLVWVQDNIRIIIVEEGKKKQLRGVMVDITKKKHAEDAMKLLNRELQNNVQQLEQCNLEISTFHEMCEMFQVCRDREEAYRIIGATAQMLFPEDSGALYLQNSSRNMLDLTLMWGKSVFHLPHFSSDSCWALRRGGTTWTVSNNQQVCSNIDCEMTRQCFCIPLLSQGETIGVFHLNVTGVKDQSNVATNNNYETKYQLAVSMGEHVAMAVSNLSLRETLRDLSIRDPLTGLFNRRYLEETLVRELMLAERMKRTLGIIMIDLDHFKRFNDLYGHDAGDCMLREFGSFLLNNIREYDIACRYGGEEFICILPETALESALERAEQLRSNLMSFKVKHLGRPLGWVTISAGVAIYPVHGTTEASIVKAADEALYQAKKQGRNQVVAAIVTPKNDAIEELLEFASS